MAAEVAKDLKKMAKMWAKTEAKQGGGGMRLPDGEYIVNIESMKVANSKKGRLQVMTTFEVKKPKEKKGKKVAKFSGLDTEDNIAYFKGFAEVIGLELPEDMEDLPEACESFVEEFEDTLTIKLSTKGDFQNISIIAVGDSEVKSGDDDENEEEDDDEKDEEDSEEEDSDEDDEGEDEDKGEDEDEDEDDDEPKKKKKSKKDKKKKKKSRR